MRLTTENWFNYFKCVIKINRRDIIPENREIIRYLNSHKFSLDVEGYAVYLEWFSIASPVNTYNALFLKYYSFGSVAEDNYCT